MQDMTRSLRYLFLLLFLGVAGTAMAQSGAITGKVLDERKQPILGAIVEVSQGGLPKGGTATDEDGNYLIKPLNPGRYDVKISYASYKTKLTKEVIVSPDKTTALNADLELNQKELDEVQVVAYKVPLIDPFEEKKIITSEEIENMPTRNTSSVVSTNPGVYQATEGGALSLGGARSEGTAYIIDGIRVYGSRGTNLAQNAIDQVEVMSSGLSAKYGDALGGVVNITTKGISDQLSAGILLEKSVDGYGHNLVNFNLAGPLFSKKDSAKNKKPIVGFRLDGDFYYDKDRRPSYFENVKVKDDKLAEIQQRPLVSVPNQNGVPVFKNATEFLRADDFETTKQRVNAQAIEGRLNGRLDFQLTENLGLVAGGTFNYSRENSYSRYLSLFSPDAMPIVQNYTGRGYIRLTQRFGKAQTQPGEKKPLISNAFYSVQADYQKEHSKVEHPDFGQDIFKYAYVGKFFTEYTQIYAPGVDDSTKLTGIKLYADHVSQSVRYERSELNPVLANYTSQYFNELGYRPMTLSQIYPQGALINGYFPFPTYGYPNGSPMFSNVGQGIGYYSYGDVSQFAVDVNASFDLQPGKTRHQIEFGLYYQQRVEKSFTANSAVSGGSNLWQYGRQLTNRHISLDFSNPQFLVGGKTYTRADVEAGLVSPSPFDTIYYNRIDTGFQSTFDMNLRKKLGVGKTDYIDIDNYDPSMFSLDMFSADELLNSGYQFTDYYGYNYLGKRQKGQVNFNDFFTKKDANGNYTRDMGAYRPSYIAAYVLDKFQFKDINFNLGLRIDRFDANTKVLKDPYSLYDVFKVSDMAAGGLNNSLNNDVVPGNIGKDYVVYVDNNASTSKKVIGYRNGDDWYDYKGKLIEDPTVLKNYSDGRDPQPWLKSPNERITDSTFDPNNSFTDYKPQVNVMPRISFSFPISDQALFFAHYDVLVQRPMVGVYATAADYYFLTTNAQEIIPNPDLKPQKMFDYEVGFKQALTKQSAITITGFYKERKDMIQVRPYLYAWPITYYTLGNRDFSTTKGLTLAYDLRRVNNIRMNVAYTLQFAEGTGSSASTTVRGGIGSGILANFIQAGLPNLRYVSVLDYDSRHTIVTTVDYRYADNEGPIVGGKHILQNAGVNFIFRTRSGEPYTKYAQPLLVGTVIEGSVNGSRQPWHYNLDMKIDKDFKIKLRKDKEGDMRKNALYVNAFVLIQNLLNTRDILPNSAGGNINGFTGRTDDDGYLASPQGQSYIQLQSNPASYVDYYNMALMNPGYINLPRRINVGLQFSF